MTPQPEHDQQAHDDRLSEIIKIMKQYAETSSIADFLTLTQEFEADPDITQGLKAKIRRSIFKSRDVYGKHPNARTPEERRAAELQKSSVHAIDEEIMYVETQHIIEQAQAEPRPPQAVEHPVPETVNELRTVAAEAYRVEQIVTELRENNIPLTKTEAEIAIEGLQDIAKRSTRTARQLGLHAVEQGLMSKAELAKHLDVSAMTITRWFRENPEQPDKPQA